MHLFGRHFHNVEPGKAPGTITIQADARQSRLDVTTFGPDADADSAIARSLDSVAELVAPSSDCCALWLNVTGLGNADTLRSIGEHFAIHPLVLEDIATTSQRSKVEEYDNLLFMVIRIPAFKGSDDELFKQGRMPDLSALGHDTVMTTRQLCLCIGTDFIITFQEQSESVVDLIRNRLVQKRGRIGSRGPDYLAYALLDVVIDTFFPLMEAYGERIEDVETMVLKHDEDLQIQAIHNIKQDLSAIRRIVWSLGEMINKVLREEVSLIHEDTKVYFRDCRDSIKQLVDVIEIHHETTTSLVNTLLSIQSNKMNDVMKVLTIIATIFIPLSWVAGVYGMNFDPQSPWNMPELAWKYGYVSVLTMMLLVACGLLFWFWRKGWIGSSGR